MIRRTIDHEHPLFAMGVADASTEEVIEFVDRQWALAPSSVRESLAFIVGRHDPELGRQMQDRRIPWMVVTAMAGTVDPGMFRESGNLIGVVGPEYPEKFGWPAVPLAARNLTEFGGTVLWSFLFNFGRLFDRDPEIYRSYREHRDRILLEIKANGFPEWWSPVEDGRCRFGRFVHYSEVMVGAWLTGLASNWGIHPEVWQWFEFGYYGHLFDYSLPGTRYRGEIADRGMYNATFHNVGFCNYPENLMAQQILNAAIHGCAAFSFEHQAMNAHFNADDNIDRCAVMPILNEIATRKLIPSREEMLRRIRAAVWTGKAMGPNMDRPESFWPNSCRRLYATTALVMQNNGRYGLIPCLPKYTPSEERRKFECLPGGYHYSYLPFLNALYPEEGTGRCFIERQGNRWFVINPYENVDQDADFKLPLYENTCETLSGRLGAHSLAIVEEYADRIDIYLSNYRVNKDEFWDRRHEMLRGDYFADQDGLLCGEVNREEADSRGKQTRCEILDQLRVLSPMANARITDLVLTGHTGREAPLLTIEGHEGFQHWANWRDEVRKYELRIQHNGVVRILLTASGECGEVCPPQGLSRNLALDQPVRVSSSAPGCPGALAVDGLLDTGWRPAGVGDQWLIVDIGCRETISACKVVGTAGGGADLRLEVADLPDGPWTKVLMCRVCGEFFRVFPVDGDRDRQWVRLSVSCLKGDLLLSDFGLYSGPNTELKTWMPLVQPGSVAELVALFREATSDAERTAIEDALWDYCQDQTKRDTCLDALRRVMDDHCPGAGMQVMDSVQGDQISRNAMDETECIVVSAIRLLGRFGGNQALEIVRAAVEDPRDAVRTAAAWALVTWPDRTPLADVLRVVRTTGDLSLRAHGLRWLLPVVKSGELTDEERDPILADGVALATEGVDRLAWVEASRVARTPQVLEPLLKCMDDPLAATWLLGAARTSVIAVAALVHSSHPVAACDALRRILDRPRDGAYMATVHRTSELLSRMDTSFQPVTPADSGVKPKATVRSVPTQYESADSHKPGVLWAAYRPTSENIREAEFDSLEPIAEGVADMISRCGILKHIRGSGLWIQFQGLLHIPESGLYAFSLRSDRQSLFFMDGREIVEATSGRDGLVTMELTGGFHPIIVNYVRGPFEIHNLRWLTPGSGLDVAATLRKAAQQEAADGIPFGAVADAMEVVPPHVFRHLPCLRTT